MNNIVKATLMVMATAVATGALAQQPAVKIGVIAEFSGPFADYGTQIVNGMKTYLKLHGDTFGGRKVEIIQRDTTGAAPDIAKRLAQELITRDNVDILAGFGLTPNALAVAPIDAEAKKPMVIMNAATSIITTRSPYIVRVSHTLPQDTQPIAQWAAKNGIKRAYHAGIRLRAGHRRGGRVRQGIQGGRRRDHRQRENAAAKS